MEKTFEERFAEVQDKMIQACLEYVDNRADFAYIYASCEYPSVTSDFFYKINGNMVERHKLGDGYDVSPKRQSACLHTLVECIHESEEVCKEYGKDMPTEMKIIYDIKNKKAEVAYRYDLVYTKSRTKSANDVVEKWFNDMTKQANTEKE